MKSVLAYATKVLFYVFAGAIIVWTGSLTVSFVSRVLPGSQIEPYLALAVFDVGALAWLLVFLFKSSGLGQRAVSLIMTAVDLVGVGLMSISELMLGGQEFMIPPEQLGTIAIWGLGIFTFANVCMVYLFHVLDPAEQAEISMGVARDKVKAKALEALNAKMDGLSDDVAEELGESMKADALRQLGVANRPALPWSARAERNNLVLPVAEVEERVSVSSPNGHRPGAV